MNIIFFLSLISFYAVVNSQKRSETSETCRFSGKVMTVEKYGRMTCSECYALVPRGAFKQKLNFHEEKGQLFTNATGVAIYYDPDFENKNNPVYQSFKTNEYAEKWAQCCQAALSCCEDQKYNSTKATGCPRDWSFYTCWHSPETSKRVEMDCPDYYAGYLLEKRSPCKRFERRQCMANGTWGVVNNFCDPKEFQRHLDDYDPEKDNDTIGCHRTDQEVELSYRAYKLDTCARCYSYLPPTALVNPLIYSSTTGYLHNRSHWAFARYELENDTSYQMILSTIPSPRIRYKWVQCCAAALDCWNHMEKQKSENPAPDGYCPMTWDGWTCFDSGVPGKNMETLCPEHVFFKSNTDWKRKCHTKSKKYCEPNGIWYVNQQKGREFTDYSPCTPQDEVARHIIMDISFLSISMAFIVPAIIIFHVYRSLRVPRIKMHVQLLVALFFYDLTNCLFKGIILYGDVTQTSSRIDNDGAFCKLLGILYKYFRQCTYFWMLCEGFYLHQQIAAAFTEQKRFWVFYIVGWGVPAILLSIYAIIRSSLGDGECWISPGTSEYLLYAPSILSLALNLIFLSHIVYILVTKLRSVQSNEPGYFRKAVRATIILIPLFGVHYFLILYNPDEDDACISKMFAVYVTSVVDGLQGFAVALIYCYLNNEVLNLLKNDWHRYKATKWIGQQSQRPSRGGRWSVSTQVSAVHSTNTPPRLKSTRKKESNGAIALPTLSSNLDAVSRAPLHNYNGSVPVTEL